MSNLAIDCRTLTWEHSGIARYLRNILTELMRIDTKNQYFLLFYPVKEKLDIPPNFIPVLGPSNFFLYKFIWTPHFLQRHKIEVYWSPTQELPLLKLSSCKYVSTIHDIAFEHPNIPTSLSVRVLQYLGIYKRSAKLADAILTDSYYSKHDIANTYQIPESRILVTYLGIDKVFRHIDKSDAKGYVKRLIGIDTPYIFYINTGRPERLLSAFANLVKNEWKENGLKLVTLGKSTVKRQDVQNLVDQLSINDRVYIIDKHVSDIELANLYAGAVFFVSPSYFEGFGLTPLEALACGTPVLVSNVASLPEIFDNIATFCNPYDPQNIKVQLLKLNMEMGHTKDRTDKNILVRKYRWENVARTIYDCLTSTLSL